MAHFPRDLPNGSRSIVAVLQCFKAPRPGHDRVVRWRGSTNASARNSFARRLLSALMSPDCKHRLLLPFSSHPHQHSTAGTGFVSCNVHLAGPSAILDNYLLDGCAMLGITLSLSVCTMHSVVASAMLASSFLAVNCRLDGHRHNCSIKHCPSHSLSTAS